MIFRYLILQDGYEPFLTNYFEAENNFSEENNMQVFDLHNCIFTKDGVNWVSIEEDHL